jgi:hypothetical protein
MRKSQQRIVRRATVAAWTLAVAALAGCWARVPASFDPPPPRLDLAALEVHDLRDRDRVVVVVLGDGGTGSSAQFEVGRRMASVCAARGCDLALLLGDNFYERGVRPPRNGVWDEAFIRKFEAPYEQLGVQFWAVAGNHDWHGGRDSVDTEIAYSARSSRWRMPAYDYAVPALPPWLDIYALDTVVLLSGVDIGQRQRARVALCDAPGWRVLAGHHPIYSSGHHAGPGGENAAAREALLPLIEECDVDVYLAGHEHHQEHLRAGNLHQIVQGAAGRLRDVELRGAKTPADQLFAASLYGFALLEFRREQMSIEFFGYPAGSPQGFGSIYRTVIRSRRPAAAAPR